MYLTLFVVFICIALVLIGLGLYKPEHSELSLIGFFFLFLLSTVLLGGDIQYKIGVNNTYSCLCCENSRVGGDVDVCGNSTNLFITSVTDNYATFETGGFASHIAGYYMAVMLFSLNSSWYNTALGLDSDFGCISLFSVSKDFSGICGVLA